MLVRAFSLLPLILAFALSGVTQSQPAQAGRSPRHDELKEEPASPQMARLAEALLGDWKTIETMEPGPDFPGGGSRRGQVTVRLLAGGTTLFYGVHSAGSAGKLDGFHLIWWDAKQGLYLFFACFKGSSSPCHARGTARWEGDKFTNEYQETTAGKTSQWRDTFLFAPGKHTLIAAVRTPGGEYKTRITTVATRE